MVAKAKALQDARDAVEVAQALLRKADHVAPPPPPPAVVRTGELGVVEKLLDIATEDVEGLAPDECARAAS